MRWSGEGRGEQEEGGPSIKKERNKNGGIVSEGDASFANTYVGGGSGGGAVGVCYICFSS